jgi:hypothetical protein
MSYENDVAQIKGGLINYIGAIITALGVNDDYTKQHKDYPKYVVNAILSEQTIDICKDQETKAIETYPFIPVLIAAKTYLAQQNYFLHNNPTQENKELMIEYKSTINTLDKIIKKTLKAVHK